MNDTRKPGPDPPAADKGPPDPDPDQTTLEDLDPGDTFILSRARDKGRMEAVKPWEGWIRPAFTTMVGVRWNVSPEEPVEDVHHGHP